MRGEKEKGRTRFLVRRELERLLNCDGARVRVEADLEGGMHVQVRHEALCWFLELPYSMLELSLDDLCQRCLQPFVAQIHGDRA